VKVVVIGAGATGLAIAYLLARAGLQVHVIEKSPIPGGLLATFAVGDCDRLEHFYHHFFTHDAEINWLLRELNLSDKVIFHETSMGVFRDGQLFPFSSPFDVLRFRPINLPSRLRFGISAAMLSNFAGYADRDEMPCLDWFQRWAGRSATEAIWKPLLVSKFGEAADRIPLAWMAGRLRQRAKSRKIGQEKLGYLEGSLQVLVDRWLVVLKDLGVTLTTGAGVDSLSMRGERVAGAVVGGMTIDADFVVATTPTPHLAELVRPINAVYASRLDSIQYLGAICTILSLKKPLMPFYWTNVTDPGYSFGGIIEQTNFVSPARYGGKHIVYLSRYLDPGHRLWTMNDAEIRTLQLAELQRLTNRDVEQDLDDCWIFRGRYAATLTDVGFHAKIPTFKSPLEGLFVASMCHIYPDERSVNNSIRVAAEAIRAMGFAESAGIVPTGLSLSAKFGGGR
jgi:protoporphyrinogen oxidase